MPIKFTSRVVATQHMEENGGVLLQDKESGDFVWMTVADFDVHFQRREILQNTEIVDEQSSTGVADLVTGPMSVSSEKTINPFDEEDKSSKDKTPY